VDSGFNYYGYRFYDPGAGRWLNRDPIGEKGGVNLYGMVGNDGVGRWDRLGLHSFINCSADQQRRLTKAIGDARAAADRASERLNSLQDASEDSEVMVGSKVISGRTLLSQFERSFGPLTQGALDKVRSNFVKTRSKMGDNVVFECKCKCEKPAWAAYVFFEPKIKSVHLPPFLG
jgi:uncharacterized protein RhaS with RHS repeats